MTLEELCQSDSGALDGPLVWVRARVAYGNGPTKRTACPFPSALQILVLISVRKHGILPYSELNSELSGLPGQHLSGRKWPLPTLLSICKPFLNCWWERNMQCSTTELQLPLPNTLVATTSTALSFGFVETPPSRRRWHRGPSLRICSQQLQLPDGRFPPPHCLKQKHFFFLSASRLHCPVLVVSASLMWLFWNLVWFVVKNHSSTILDSCLEGKVCIVVGVDWMVTFATSVCEGFTTPSHLCHLLTIFYPSGPHSFDLYINGYCTIPVLQVFFGPTKCGFSLIMYSLPHKTAQSVSQSWCFNTDKWMHIHFYLWVSPTSSKGIGWQVRQTYLGISPIYFKQTEESLYWFKRIGRV